MAKLKPDTLKVPNNCVRCNVRLNGTGVAMREGLQPEFCPCCAIIISFKVASHKKGKS